MYGAKVIGVVVGPDGVLFEFDRAHHRGKQAVLRNEVNRVIRMVCGTIGVPEVSFPTARTLLLPGAQDARISTIAALYTLLSSTPLVPRRSKTSGSRTRARS